MLPSCCWAMEMGTVTPEAVTRKVTSALSMSRGTFIIAVMPEVSGENGANPAIAVIAAKKSSQGSARNSRLRGPPRHRVRDRAKRRASAFRDRDGSQARRPASR